MAGRQPDPTAADAASASASADDDNIRPPFDLHTIIGFNPTVPPLNLTDTAAAGARRVCVAIAAAHIVTIHTGAVEPSPTGRDTTATVQHLVGGHSFVVHTLAADATGRFVLTAGRQSCVIWDRQCLVDNAPAAIRQLYRPYGDAGRIEHAAISPDGNYVLLSGTADAEDHPAAAAAAVLQFWLWSAGRQRPECEHTLAALRHGPVQAVAFNPFNMVRGAEFAVTLHQSVLFGQWTAEAPHAMLVRRPRNSRLLTVSGFRATVFSELPRSAFTISTEGTCTVWSCEIGSTVYTAAKTMRVDTVPLVGLHYVDEMVVVLAAGGRMRFYDCEMRIVYDGDDDDDAESRGACAQTVSFDLDRRRYRLIDPQHSSESRLDDEWRLPDGGRQSRFKSCADDPTVEVLFVDGLPKCTTIDQRPFIVRNCLQLDGHGRLRHCDLVRRQTVELPLAVASGAHIAAFDVHPHRSLLCAGCTDGRLFLYDVGRRELVLERTVPQGDDGAAVRLVRFVADGNEVLVASQPRVVCLVDSIMLAPIGRPIHPAAVDSASAIQHVCVTTTTAGQELIAYVEADNALVLLQRTPNAAANGVAQLRLIGKHLSHTDAIAYVRFAGADVASRLLTFAADRQLTEYDVVQSLAAGELVMVQRRTYDQTAWVTAALGIDACPATSGGDVLTFDSTMKVKCWHTDDDEPSSSMIRRTAVGPLLDGQPVRCACHIPRRAAADGDAFVAFATGGNLLGLHLLPFDGNAFRHVGMMAHPHGVCRMHAAADGRTLFTLGRNDYAIFEWRIRRRAVYECVQRGGAGLMPFCRALPGGRDGWLFREMQDLFYYMQILKRGCIDSPDEQTVAQALHLADVPDYLRGLGLFLSEFEAHNVLVELSDNRPEMAARVLVSFGDLVRVYVNHRPTRGYAMAELQAGIKSIAVGNKQLLDRDRLMDLCCTKGEPMGRAEAARYLRALLSPDDGPPLLMVRSQQQKDEAAGDKGQRLEAKRLLAVLPEVFSVHDLLENMFGLETTSDDVGGFSFLYGQCDDPGLINATLNNEPQDM